MSEVLVRNLDEAVVEQLKARGSGRSLQAVLETHPGACCTSGTNTAAAGSLPGLGGSSSCLPRRPASVR